ncbi:maintenance of mitochondrial morphology protein 1 [Parastagonospora nodorum]|nr:maintenance of mitochondrial morphology protein 1 [Parastagonospora nodorum]KAH4015907.1 maintenance of mitochondrial morphology protein 1 [Parastagonospora nodorum]KAH4218828.1 maintenance of mitochondrial morphology protein 1 [Parastagonospora nodorum]KAH4227769.1 maintenance of mitochondrial morphology protein 1 [Parastagonospora nodorum]KAH4980408.1 maintenance of mitochondrial morphology protein 1 [Parastagonospora nodorum]
MATQVATPLPLPTPQSSSSLSFTQGFLLGQLSIALLIFFFIKFFIFGEPPSADDRSLHLNSLRRARTLAHQQSIKQLRTRSNSISLSLRHKDSRSIIRKGEETRGGPSIATILAKTYYNVKGHQPESLDWFNVLIAQTIAQLRADARQDDAILGSLTEVLNSGSKPDWIGEIKVNEIALGDEFPIFSNCRVMPAEDGFWYGPGTTGTEEGRLQARMDVDLSDVITIGIETTLNLNWPKPLSAVLPVALAVSIVRFSGTLALSFIPSSSPPSTSTTTPNPEHHRSNSTTSSSTSPPHRPTTLAFTFLDDYRLDLSVRSLVGSRSRLQDVPKIAQLIESRVHAWFDERAVEPRFQQIVLPSLWPRKHNTRGGATEDVEASEADLDEEVILEEEEEEEEEDGGYTLPVPPQLRHPSAASTSLEAEGAKLREAEIRAGVRKQERPGMNRAQTSREEGVRYRPKPVSRTSEGWSGQKGMPGALAPGTFR